MHLPPPHNTPPAQNTPFVILIFGHNCAGKSTIGALLATSLENCAFVEVDELRYKIKGGLVAWGAGAPPVQQPAEYERQCRLAERNAVRLAHGFLEAGFSCVIDNLEQEFAEDVDWAAQEFPHTRVIRLRFFCDQQTLQARLEKRHGRSVLTNGRQTETPSNSFTHVVDTSRGNPAIVVASILQSLGLPHRPLEPGPRTSHFNPLPVQLP